MSDVTEKLRFNVIAGIAPITSQEAIDEIDCLRAENTNAYGEMRDLRAALSERDRMLNMARQNIAGDLCALGIQQSAIYAVLTRLDLSAYDASKNAAPAGKDGA